MNETASSSTMRRTAWVILFCGLAVFSTIAFLVMNDLTGQIDRQFVLILRNPLDLSDAWGPDWFQETAAELTALGGYPILILVSIVVVIALLIVHKGSAAFFLLATLISGSAASSALKLLFNRPRPDLVDHLDKTFTSSFPSGHAMVSMIAWLTLAAVAIRFVKSRSLRIYMLWGAVIIALMIGMTRVYLGVHWPSDVIAGWAMGLTWASFSWLIADAFWQKSLKRRERNDAMGRSG
ncbi:phosphatase PAP2 family protein [Pararhizobium sp. IMCC21322]|uniref:phosphatase PAP2 family protein n=1 Tax=Pararhizobium sp. IMCC21322 TaxID=3067903 RepID=UPI00274233C3|nr:phosphatase PAP2 family protein [Pararhizobium sp. IMCC21322]